MINVRSGCFVIAGACVCALWSSTAFAQSDAGRLSVATDASAAPSDASANVVARTTTASANSSASPSPAASSSPAAIEQPAITGSSSPPSGALTDLADGPFPINAIEPIAEPHAQPSRLHENRCHEHDGVHDIADLDLEALLRGEVAMSYSRSAERVDDAPIEVTVVTREQIRAWGYQSVAEILEDVVGFYVVDDQMIPNVAVRGISGGPRAESGGLKVMIDGRPVPFRPTGGNWLGPELIPMSLVERVEIVRGPASTVYGADAFLGVINVITRSGEDVCGGDLWLAGNYAGGPGGAIDTSVGTRHGHLSAVLSLHIDRLDRSGLALPDSSPAPALRSGVMRNQLAQRLLLDSGSAFERITYHIDDHNSVSLTSTIAGINRSGDFSDWSNIATGLDASGRQRGTVVSLFRGFVNLSGDFQPRPTLQIAANAGFFGGAPTPNDRIDVNSEASYVRRIMDFKSGLFDVAATWTPRENLRLVGGADYLIDHETLPGALRVLLSDSGTLHAGDVIESASTRQGTRDFQNLGVFVLGSWTPTGDQRGRPMLRADAGLRYDYNDLYGSQVNGRIGLSLRLLDKLTFRANYASAFRAPTPLLLYGTPLTAGDILGNSALRTQQIHTWEGGLVARPWSWLRVQSALSYSYVRDQAEFVQVGDNSVAQNLGELGVWSWETDVRVNWREMLSVYANFALVQGVRNLDETGYVARLLGSSLEVYPAEVLNAGINYRFPVIPLRLMVRGRYISERRASDTNVVETGAIYTLPPAFYLDASASLVDFEALPDRKTTITFMVRNLLDNNAAQPGFSGIDYPSAPRTFFLQLQQQL